MSGSGFEGLRYVAHAVTDVLIRLWLGLKVLVRLKWSYIYKSGNVRGLNYTWNVMKLLVVRLLSIEPPVTRHLYRTKPSQVPFLQTIFSFGQYYPPLFIFFTITISVWLVPLGVSRHASFLTRAFLFIQPKKKTLPTDRISCWISHMRPNYRLEAASSAVWTLTGTVMGRRDRTRLDIGGSPDSSRLVPRKQTIDDPYAFVFSSASAFVSSPHIICAWITSSFCDLMLLVLIIFSCFVCCCCCFLYMWRCAYTLYFADMWKRTTSGFRESHDDDDFISVTKPGILF